MTNALLVALSGMRSFRGVVVAVRVYGLESKCLSVVRLHKVCSEWHPLHGTARDRGGLGRLDHRASGHPFVSAPGDSGRYSAFNWTDGFANRKMYLFN